MTPSVPIKTHTRGITIQHPQFRLSVSEKDGTWSLFDRAAKRGKLSGAGFRLDARGVKPWDLGPEKIRLSTKTRKSVFGEGTVVTITRTPARKSYRPITQVHLTVYPEHPFVELGWSVRNHRGFEMRIRNVDVLYGGKFLSGATLSDPLHLKGGAGAEKNAVTPGGDVECHNSAMVTGKLGGERHSLVAGGLAYTEFARSVELLPGLRVMGNDPEPGLIENGERNLSIFAWDPEGKRVPPNTTYHSPDTSYLDVVTANPFEALETYGLALRAANHANPHAYDFPTLCGWLISTESLGEGRPINHSTGLVDQMKRAGEMGLLNYTPLAVRLEPDYYCQRDHGNTQQGWWDDEHFAKYGSLTKPYETFAAWCGKITELGGIPFTYFQVSLPSNDFALAHPDWMLHKDISDLHRTHAHHRPWIRYDYSSRGFQEHMRGVWKRMRNAGLKGVKFDYPETGWNTKGGFEDPETTTTRAYTRIFELCKEGLGEDSYVHERNLGGQVHETAPRLDVTAGTVDLQRIWNDSNHFEPEMASRMGLRWYKSRSVFHYYPDGKSFVQNGKPLPAYQRRAFLTLIAFLGGRLELGCSFNLMTKPMLHDLTRLYPIFPGIRSPRPVDMLVQPDHPSVYAYEVEEGWIQVLLVNNGKKRTAISTTLSADSVEEGGLGLDGRGSWHAFDFWRQAYVGTLKGTQSLSADLRPGEVAMMSLRRKRRHPQVLSTNRHIMQGMVETRKVEWKDGMLRGELDVVAGEPFVLTLAGNGNALQEATVSAGKARLKKRKEPGLYDVSVISSVNQTLQVTVS